MKNNYFIKIIYSQPTQLQKLITYPFSDKTTLTLLF